MVKPTKRTKTTGKLPQGRPKSAGLDQPEHGPSTQVAIRFPPEMLDRVDGWTADFNRRNPGVALTRSDAVRALVARALDGEGR